MKKAYLYFFAVLISLLLLLAIAYIGVQCLAAPDLSSYDPGPGDYALFLYDCSGAVIETEDLSDVSREDTSLDEIPEAVLEIFLTAEDPDFYQEKGIQEEGSITRALVRTTLFSTWEQPKGLLEKINRWIREEYLVLKLENTKSKDWILEKYMNTLEFGAGMRGIREAAEYWFHTSPEDLTIEQAEILVSYAQNQQKEGSQDAGNASSSQESGSSSSSQAVESASESQKLEGVSDWFQRTLLQTIAEDLEQTYGYTETEAWALIVNGGLRIYSTEDCTLQSLCEETAGKSIYNRNSEQVSIVMIDSDSGAVNAIIGGRKEKSSPSAISGKSTENTSVQQYQSEYGMEIDADFMSGGTDDQTSQTTMGEAGGQTVQSAADDGNDQTGQSASESGNNPVTETGNVDYERRNRAVEWKRDPGLALSVLGQYAAGLESGTYTLASIFEDDIQGKLTLHEAIHSVSRSAAQQAYEEIGSEEAEEMLADFGIEDAEAGVSNLELTAAYGTLARGGVYTTPYFYTKVTDLTGKVLLENDPVKKRILDEDTAGLLTLAMEDPFQDSTGVYEKVNTAETAGLYTVTDQETDGWFVGYSRYYTCGIWGGYDDGSEQEDCSYLRKIWRTIMDDAHEGIEEAREKELVDTSQYFTEQICAKCGNLAVSGLCDASMQGNEITEEYFVRGTLPYKKCDCHVKLKICTESEMLAGKNCPSDEVITGIYLKSAVAGSADEAYSAQRIGEEECTIHSGDTEE